MVYIFRKQKMLDRLAKNGIKESDIDAECMDIMNKLDGHAATPSCWRRQVYQEPVMWVPLPGLNKNNGAYVHEEDVE